MKLQVTVKWKRQRYYPANMTAKMFCMLLKQLCLAPRDIEVIKNLGYEVEEIVQTTELVDFGSKLVIGVTDG